MNQPVLNQTVPLHNEFRAGVTACLRSWSALKHAVESGWGGVDSVEKADTLRQCIIDQIEKGQLTDPVDLEDNLAIYMEEEFSLQLEDGSEKQVANFIWTMYEQCCRGETTLVQHVMQGAEQAAVIARAIPSQMQSNEDDEDDEDMTDAVEENEAPSLVSMLQMQPGYATESLFGKPKPIPTITERPVRQLGETEAPPNKITEDDDGFAVVTKERRKTK